MFETIDKEVIKKQLPDMLENLEVAGLDTLLTCPFPDKHFGKNTIMKRCGIINLNSENKYCQPQRIEECKLIYGERKT